jgi:hypothetical protein
MPDPITIKLHVADDGTLSMLDQAGEKVGQFGQRAGQGQSGLAAFAAGALQAKAAVDLMGQALGTSLGMIDNVNQLGVASLRAKESLNTLSGGQADAYLRSMSEATRGLIPNIDLAHNATKALSLGLVTSADQAAKLARAGTILGMTLGGDAAQGVETLTTAMTRVGLTGLLDNIGLSGERVKARFQELRASLGDQGAWSAAVLEEAAKKAEKMGGALESTGSAVDRLKTKWENLKAAAAENVAFGIEATINFVTAINDLNQKKAVPTPEEKQRLVEQAANPPAKGSFQKMYEIYAGQAYAGEGPFGPPVWTQSGMSPAPWANQPSIRSLLPQMNLFDDRIDSATRSYMAQAQAVKLSQAAQAAAGVTPLAYGVTGLIGDFVSSGGIRGLGQNPSLQLALQGGMEVLGHNKNITDSINLFVGNLDRNTEGFRLLAAAMPGIRSAFLDVQGAGNQLAAWWKKHVTDQKDYGSTQEAFGLKQGGIAGELTSGFEQALETRRADLVKRHDKELGKFDIAAKDVMDQYRIATGQATTESIAFESITAKLNQRVAAGTVDIRKAGAEYLALANAVRTGHGDLSTMYSIMIKMGDLKAPKEWTAMFGKDFGADALEGEMRDVKGHGLKPQATAKSAGETKSTALSYFDDIVASAKAVQNEVAKLPNVTQTAAQGMVGPAQIAANSMKPITASAQETVKWVGMIGQALRGLAGRITIETTVHGAVSKPGAEYAPGAGR